MPSRLLLAATIVLVFAGSYWAKARLGEPAERAASDSREAARIVCMAPSITETLYALGLGDRVAGVTRFCRYPPEVRAKAKIGGYFDPNFEAIVALRPDLVVMLAEHQQWAPAFRKLGLRTLAVRQIDVPGIRDSITAIGRACGAEAKAAEVLGDIDARLSRVREKVAGRPRPRVLVVVNRNLGSGRLEDVYVASGEGHLGTVLELAGGQNAYRQGPEGFPIVSSEGILHIDPEVIIDVVSDESWARWGEEAIRADWQQVREVEAVRSGRVHVFADDRACLPGPRFIRLVEAFARLLHPGIDWR
jgi:iron complex transport system substrate-binding protein